jgi:hypothetical protein
MAKRSKAIFLKNGLKMGVTKVLGGVRVLAYVNPGFAYFEGAGRILGVGLV